MLEVSREVEATTEEAWALLTDTSRWVVWGPTISAVDSQERFLRAGTRGRVRTVFGIWVPFAVTRYERGHAWSWRIHGARATGHRVEALGPSRCRVVFEVPWSAAPYALVCRLALRRIADALERHRRPPGHEV